MCMGREDDIASMDEALQSIFRDEIHTYRSKSTYLELAPLSVSKATALSMVMSKCFDLGLDEVMAFGDNYNDIDMIRSVGWGIVVGNARPEVKEVAREITVNSVEDGVAIAIEKYAAQIMFR